MSSGLKSATPSLKSASVAGMPKRTPANSSGSPSSNGRSSALFRIDALIRGLGWVTFGFARGESRRAEEVATFAQTVGGKKWPGHPIRRVRVGRRLSGPDGWTWDFMEYNPPQYAVPAQWTDTVPVEGPVVLPELSLEEEDEEDVA